MNDISRVISKSIKEEKWVSIDYINQEQECTSYWCAVIDIDIDEKKLIADAFNISKVFNSNKGVLRGISLLFDNIKKAKILEHTTYIRPVELIQKINCNLESLSWLGYDLYNEKTLDYIAECIKLDSVCYQKETSMISSIDETELKKTNQQGYYSLSLEQLSELVKKVEKISKQDKKRQYQMTELALNILSISTHQGLFVAIYKTLLLDPIERKLVLQDELNFNYEFASDKTEGFRHNLRNYLDIETDDFAELFIKNPKKAKSMLGKTLNKSKEILDDRPYIMDLVRNNNGYIDKELKSISQNRAENQLSIPLKAFFGNMDTTLLHRKRNFDIVLLDDKINIDQLRVIHNALKQPITYVQGPPGTGKTQSIINLLISAFFNNKTVLVSSNNNKPIDDIYNKIQNLKSKGNTIPLPILRLGNNEKLRESIENIKFILSNYEHYKSDDNKLSSIEDFSKNSMKELNDTIEQYERRLELVEEIDALKSMLSYISSELRTYIIIQAELEKKQGELSKLPEYSDEDFHKHVYKASDTFFTWLFFTSVKYIKRLKEPKYNDFIEILNIENDDERIKKFNSYIHKPDKLSLIQRVFPIIMTTNQSAYKLGEPKATFDLTVIDEAGQCSIGYALFPIIRGKNLLLVGDQNQLRPVITLSPEVNKKLIKKHNISDSYNYIENSIIMLMQRVDSVSKFVLLRYHYRCHKDIIGFSNKKYYHKKLIIPDKKPFEDQALYFIDVNQKKIKRSNIRNSSLFEVDTIIKDLENKKDKSVGIITPFRNQANLIKDRLNQEKIENVDVGTVHTFQGDEKDVIYFSSAINHHSSHKTFDWIKNNSELLNVATTRAKKEFVMVTDFEEISKRSKKTSDLFELSNYVKANGKEVKITEKDTLGRINNMSFKQFNTAKEKELLETLNQLLSIAKKYRIEKQVKVSSILNRFSNNELFDYGTKAVFDFVIFERNQNDDRPKLVVELNGDEHQNNPKVNTRDMKKKQICDDNNIELIVITNDYTRRYMHIKETIFDIFKIN